MSRSRRRSKSASLIVDPQVGFTPKRRGHPGSGELAVPEGHLIAEPIVRFEDAVWLEGVTTFMTRDQHSPKAGAHFERHGRHCVRRTPGAEFLPELVSLSRRAEVFDKGTHPDRHDYTGFKGHHRKTGRTLLYELRRRGIRVLYISGLATEYCVMATVMDALKYGFKVVLLTDAIRAVDSVKGAEAIAAMVAAGVICKTTKEIVAGWRLTA
jgi:nicotinamidase/pyrazinamidase